MFCTKCGQQLEDNAKFCIKCGTAAQISPILNTPLAYAETQTSWQNQPKTTKLPKMKSKLLMTAIIVAPLILVTYTFGVFISSYNEKRDIENNFDLKRQDYVNSAIEQMRLGVGTIFARIKMETAIISFVVGFVILSISTILNVQGEKKNSRQMILTAGIIYTLIGTGFLFLEWYRLEEIAYTATVIGIPSAILCFIAYAKMKKQV
jgi:hypothetical protein